MLGVLILSSGVKVSHPLGCSQQSATPYWSGLNYQRKETTHPPWLTVGTLLQDILDDTVFLATGNLETGFQKALDLGAFWMVSRVHLGEVQ